MIEHHYDMGQDNTSHYGIERLKPKSEVVHYLLKSDTKMFENIYLEGVRPMK